MSDDFAGMRIELAGRRGWSLHREGGVTLWFSGYLNGRTPAMLARFLQAGLPTDANLAMWLRGIDGHFAFVATAADWVLAVVDRIRSIPLQIADHGNFLTVGADGAALAAGLAGDRSGLGVEAALAIGMSGYALGSSTLYLGLSQLRPGECLVFERIQARRIRYYAYRAWEVHSCRRSEALPRLAEVTLSVLGKMIDGAAGRPIVVPLSAGLDSRLIVSGLAHLGYRNVKCFAYGQPGNFEAKASQRIAQQLGFPWTFVPFTLARQRDTFSSAQYGEYRAFSDCCASVPFPQDFLAIRELTERRWIEPGAIIVNGNSGDYISGGHIPTVFETEESNATPARRMERLFDALVAKHFSLWRYLKTAEHLAAIRRQILDELHLVGAELGEANADHGLYEFVEWQERQCKYVVTGQRVYEFFGHDWRLPLWSNDYLDFWEHLPRELKLRQRLYREMLEQQNWGGVWTGGAIRRYVSPFWIRPARALTKMTFAFGDREKWREFERQYMKYWMDVVCNYACVPYQTVALDRRGFRNAISWHVEKYLAQKGMALTGGLLEMQNVGATP